MKAQTLKSSRSTAGWTQVRLAKSLGVTQAYLSLMETGRRRVSNRVARAVSVILDTPATELPLEESPQMAELTNFGLADELAKLDYPGFAYLRMGRATLNPAALALRALTNDVTDARVMEAVPWLLLHFEKFDVESVLRAMKLHDHQNRFGFMVALAREVAERNPQFEHRLDKLRALERRVERSRLVGEDTLGQPKATERMRAWLRDHRSDLAKHWNVLTDLRSEHLPYAAHNSGTVAELPS
jgi:transcriptional regulator with XRE-family HTH domain